MVGCSRNKGTPEKTHPCCEPRSEQMPVGVRRSHGLTPYFWRDFADFEPRSCTRQIRWAQMAQYKLKSSNFNQSGFRTSLSTRNLYHHCKNPLCKLEPIYSHADLSPKLHQTAATYHLKYIAAIDRRKQDISMDYNRSCRSLSDLASLEMTHSKRNDELRGELATGSRNRIAMLATTRSTSL